MIVLDCDAAINIACESDEGQALQDLMLDGERCLAPTTLYAETSNALLTLERMGKLDKSQLSEKMGVIVSLVDEFIDMADLWLEVLEEASRLKHPAYDIFYLVTARRHGATLFTLNQKLQKLCASAGVNCLFTDKA